jgi:hypothetical protein
MAPLVVAPLVGAKSSASKIGLASMTGTRPAATNFTITFLQQHTLWVPFDAFAIRRKIDIGHMVDFDEFRL